MSKFKKVIKNYRVIILLVLLLFAFVSIHPRFGTEGVSVRNVIKNSSAELAGFEKPTQDTAPVNLERITAINNKEIKDINDYNDAVDNMVPEKTYTFRTEKTIPKKLFFNKEKKVYHVKPRYITEVMPGNGTEWKEVDEIYPEFVNGSYVNSTRTKTVLVNKTITITKGIEPIGLDVINSPVTNIRKGLDLQGGTRVVLKPETNVEPEEMEIIVTNMIQRLDVFGVADVAIRPAGDLSGNQYILVEIAGKSEDQVKDLISNQGKFEAKVGNTTVFRGGEDIKHVCRSAECAGIDPQYGCQTTSQGESCRFRFVISLSPEAAQQQADATKDLEVIEGYLSEKIVFYLDDQIVDELNIGADLKGQAATEVKISVSGLGSTREQAAIDGKENMKRLQSVLVTGSLPVKLEIVKSDVIPPTAGKLVGNAWMVGIIALLAVALIVLIKYKKIIIALPLLFTSISEVVLILWMAALIGWNLDLAAIAGIVIAVGTGVDHQIIITDELLKGEHISNWKGKIKNAFFIIISSYFTTMAAMTPLLFAGAGLLRGFAITTMIGLSFGVFITRPAYAAMIEILLKE